MSEIKYSFEQWCIDNDRHDLLDRWDYCKNNVKPSDANKSDRTKRWFKCPRGIHESQYKSYQDIVSGRQMDIPCKACNSFAQRIIDNYSDEYLQLIWSEKNISSPWEYGAGSNKKAWFVCDYNHEHVYEMVIYNRAKGCLCPFCINHQIDNNNSLLHEYPQVALIWSEKNELTPNDYSPCSGKYAWWKCNNQIHDDYYRKISDSKNANFECPECKKHPKHSVNFKDLTGMQFGELTVISYYGRIRNEGNWLCLCSCGTEKIVRQANLNNGSVKTCGNRLVHNSGENNPSWKGGVTPDNILARTSEKYSQWRLSVLKNDSYQCVVCGSNRLLEAHHILPFSDYIDRRYDVSNGCTLCYNHHSIKSDISFHKKYGTRNNTPGQLEEYINNERKKCGNNEPFDIYEYMNNKKIVGIITDRF